ncbi:MAG: hypothetical protein UX92_C0009G0018 [Candidatus Amesbacteria bacterium GW2011_GWA1_47_20]|uniref:Uncharacterized protein n=1 Tax=Candidatus Amesbacteria bacterium GW2011_GWA1_47_20 TaxID=1618354 RepID=A0A0G1UUU7_9BACT|nr:MAG: hypothetical protein UX42_C0004G0031 [Microgenomates group bacterium GW2011_GWC1_46_20]KKU69808.1 MAG: hypothetical protein UX92_C0009G0018 [Candidatus Amesbacteria bacterium GW2011_GWA1_47_20]
MLELPHTLIGAAIATAIPDPRISLPLALLSHFVTEYIPHWNPHLFTELKTLGHITRKTTLIVAADATAALILGTWIALRSPRPLIILAACFLAVLPDVLEIPYFFFGWRPKIEEKLVLWQRSHQLNVKPIWGIICQLAVVVVTLYFTLSA